jgi:hypothetical protein
MSGARVGISGLRLMGHRTWASISVQWPVALAILAVVSVVELLGLVLKLAWRGTAYVAERLWAAHHAVKPGVRAALPQ